MNLNRVGVLVRDWQDYNFKPNKVRCALQLCEESGEVARAVGKEQDGIMPNSRGSIADELGDVILAAVALADRCGVDLESVVSARLERCLGLNFVRYPDEGRSGASAAPGPFPKPPM